jgi:hypothetical protein
MKRLLFLFSILCFLVFPKSLLAQSEEKFSTSTSVSYTVQADGKTNVSYAITLENLDSQTYATSYSLIVAGIDPRGATASQGDKKLPLEIKKETETTELKATFEDPVVGLGQKREFRISYLDSTVASRQGEVWEVEIPKLAATNHFRSYQLQLVVPQSLGEVAFISPNPIAKTSDDRATIYTFNEKLLQKGVSAAFGKFQVFSYDLTYHLENPLSNRAYIEIALPPDTANQKVILNKIDPKPDDFYTDLDGNWIAKYILDSRARIDVKANGHAQIFSTPYKHFEVSQDVLEKSLLPSQYWQSDDPKVKELAEKLKTPEAIYDYVVSTLHYDYDRVKPNIPRFGALKAIESPNNAICMEFTDLFVAIARAAGIPAREVNGYAYAENPELQPLSLVADVLHSWAEYWDAEKRVWVPVDPTWGSTTGGVDFFHKLDLRHFAFVVHGQDAVSPFPAGSYKLGANPQKDVFVTFSTLPEDRDPKPTMSISSQSSNLFSNMEVKIKFANEGSSALYDQSVDIYFDGVLSEEKSLASLLPHSAHDLSIVVPVNFLGRNMPQMVTVEFAGQALDIPTHKDIVLLSNLSLLFLIFFVILLAAMLKLRKNTFKIKIPWKRIKLKK